MMTGDFLELVQLTGELSQTDVITCELSDTVQITSDITLPEVIAGRQYDGDYEVTPDFIEQTLETRGLLMTDDVSVHPIQVSRTTNPSGGTTVFIGGTING